jgi:5-methylthioadenosine/S-adenosylhomocysteine deaminase
MYDLIIKNATIVSMDENYTVYEDHDIGIANGLITKIEPNITDSSNSGKIDASGKLVAPGLVNTHTHVGMSYFKGTKTGMELFKWLEWGWHYIERMDSEDVYWASMLSCMEMIRAGVTTFCDMYFNENQIALAVESTGLRACLGEAIIEPAAGMDTKNSLEKQFETVLNLIESWHGKANGRIHIFIAPHSPYACSQSTLERCAHLVDKFKSRFHIHLSETKGEVEDAVEMWGLRPPEYLDRLGLLDFPIIAAHCVHLNLDDINLLDRPTFGVSHNVASNLKLQSGIAPISRMTQRSMAIGIGSDGNGSNDIVDILKDVYLATIIHPWLEEQKPAHTCLSMATREGARALGLDNQIGSVEIGKKADLIVINTNSARTTPIHDPHLGLALTVRGDDVITTIIDGKIVMNDGHFYTLDKDEVLNQAHQRANRIFRNSYQQN